MSLTLLVVVSFLGTTFFSDAKIMSAQTSGTEQPDTGVSSGDKSLKSGSTSTGTSTTTTTAAKEEMDLTVIFDGSGSMTTKFGEETRIDAVRKVVGTSLESLPEKTNLALWSYGHRYSSQEKEKSCGDAEEVYLYAAYNVDKVTETLKTLKANGNSPVAYTLEQVFKSLKTKIGKKHVILLLSDSEDSCAGSPSKVVKDNVSATNSVLHVVGLGLGASARAELEAAAVAGNGTFTEAADKDALTSAITKVVNKISENQTSTEGLKRIVGGASFAEAKVFDPADFNTELALKNNLAADTKEYWKVVLTGGQGLKITVKTAAKDIQFGGGGEAKETDDAPSAAVSVFDASQKELFNVSIQQKKNETISGEVWEVAADKDTNVFYLAAGYWLPINRDMRAQFDLLEQYDSAVGKTDAAGDVNLKLSEITSGEYTGYLSGNDKNDYYQLNLSEGQDLAVSLTPEDKTTEFALELYDSGKKLITSKNAGQPGEKIDLQHKATVSGEYYLGLSKGMGKYALTISITGEKVAAESQETTPQTNQSGADLITTAKKTSFWDQLTTNPLTLGLVIGVPLLFVIALAVVFVMLIRRRKKKAARTKGVGSLTATPPGKVGEIKTPEIAPKAEEKKESLFSETPEKSEEEKKDQGTSYGG